LGSVAALISEEGAVSASYRFDAFGEVLSQQGESRSRFGFTGHQRDAATDLYYFKARYYAADQGRFISSDSYDGTTDTPESRNHYLYAYANPTVYIDLTGYATVPLFSQPIDDSTFQLPTFNRIDTGNDYVDGALATVAAIPNIGISLLNTIPAGLNAPLKTSSVLLNKSQDEISDTLTATAMSTGPAAPLVFAGELPMVPAMAMNRANRMLKSLKNDERALKAISEEAKAVQNKSLLELQAKQAQAAAAAERSDIPPSPKAPETKRTIEESSNPSATKADDKVAKGKTLIIPKEKSEFIDAYRKKAKDGTLVRTDPSTVRGSGYRKRLTKEKGEPPGPGYDADHTVELCVGGADCEKTNGQWLEQGKNRSAGSKIGQQTKDDPLGTKYTDVEIEE
jgi:RHS repeat-associated protein